MTEALIVSPVVGAVGLALVQFLWQGAAIGVLSAIALRALGRATSDVRYGVACLGLAAMLLAPVATTLNYLRDLPIDSASPAAIFETAQVPVDDHGAPSSPGPAVFSRAWIDRQAPRVVSVWSVGVLCLGLQLLSGWWRVVRIRRSASPWSSAHWGALIRGMADRLRIDRRIRLLASPLVDTPAVIGWLRPAIVVPVSVLSGLSPAHLEAVLAHELAHIRRGDFLINVAQRVVETLLFYHPAVWWLSKQIRIEREHCCDDMAVSLLVDRVAYADALTSLEELRADLPALAMSARGGELLRRIRRLVEPARNDDRRWSGGIVMTAAIAVVLLVFGGQLNGSPGRVADASATLFIEREPLVAPTLARAPVAAAQTAPQGSAQIQEDARARQMDDLAQRLRELARQKAEQQEAGADAQRARAAEVERAALQLQQWRRDAEQRAQKRQDMADAARRLQESANTMRQQVTEGVESRSRSEQALENMSQAQRLLQQNQQQVEQTAAGYDALVREYLELTRQLVNQGRIDEAEQALTRTLEALRAMRQPPAVPTPGATGAPIRVGGDIAQPRKINTVAPMYPAEARAAGIAGVVILEATIAADGSVKAAKVLRSIPGLDEAALEAVRQWKYAPTLLNGVPTEVLMTVTVNFSLN